MIELLLVAPLLAAMAAGVVRGNRTDQERLAYLRRYGQIAGVTDRNDWKAEPGDLEVYPGGPKIIQAADGQPWCARHHVEIVALGEHHGWQWYCSGCNDRLDLT